MNTSNTSTEIEANSLLTLQLTRMFKGTGMEIRPHKTDTGSEIGIDFFFEVISSQTRSHEFLFALQNKGSEDVTFLKRSRYTKISFQLSLRHTNYYFYEVKQPIIFTVCDTTTDKIYWHAIQLDQTLPGKIKAQKTAGKGSLKIEIDSKNFIDKKNCGRLIEAIKRSADEQFHKQKTGIVIRADYTFIGQRQQKLNIVEKALDTIKLFQGINVLPIEVFEKLPPFKGTDRTNVKGETLETDSEDFFRLMAQISLEEDQYILADSSLTENIQNDIKHILDFLKIHFIEHVTWIGKSEQFQYNDRICVHKLYTYGDCQCERCSYKDFAFNRTSLLLAQSNASLTTDEKLRKAYTFYLVGDYYNAYQLYKDILQELTISEDAITYIICKFNLLQLKKFINSFRYGNQANSIIDDIDKVSFEFDALIVPPHFRDVFNQLKDLSFINASLWKVDQILTEAQKINYNDKLGSYSINKKPDSLIIDFTRAYNFIEYNLLIFTEYREFEVLVNKALEAAFAFNSLRNPISTKYKHFSARMIEMWVFHAETNHIKYLINKYNIKVVPTTNSDQTIVSLQTYIDNLIDSKDYILREIENDNFGFVEKIRKVTANILVIIAKVEMSDAQANALFSKIVAFCSDIGNWKVLPSEEIKYFLSSRTIEIINLQSLLTTLNDKKARGHGPFKSVVNHLSDLATAQELDELFYELLDTETIDKVSLIDSKNFRHLGHFLSKILPETKLAVEEVVHDRLQEDFDATLFYYYCIYGLIAPSKEYLTKFIAGIPDFTKIKSGHEMITGRKELRNYRLDELINIFYKYKIKFTAEHRKLSKLAFDTEYYDWLMDLENYNYENFDPYWIMAYETEHYLTAFKNSPKLLSAISRALKYNYIEGVAKIYFEHLIN